MRLSAIGETGSLKVSVKTEGAVSTTAPSAGDVALSEAWDMAGAACMSHAARTLTTKPRTARCKRVSVNTAFLP
jgi:hypothetical protein